MTRNIFAVLLNLTTLIGGHFVNRRWDRAVFILGLLLLSGAAYFAYLSISFEQVTDSEDALNRAVFAWQTFVYTAIAVWALSLILTVYDIRHRSEQCIGGIAGNLGAIVLSFMMFLVSAVIAWNALVATDVVSLSGSREFNKTYFSEYLSFGMTSGYMGDNDEPPVGEAQITGKVTYNNQPVEGVSVKLGLNDKYQTKRLFSGKDGRFSIKVPAGDWTINLVEIGGWRDRPEGDFMVLSGHEPMLTGSEYNEHANMSMQGLPVIASTDNEALALELVIKPKVSIEWPPLVSYRDRDKEKNEASVQDSQIAWQPYEGASQYVVRVSRMEKDGDSTIYHKMGDYLLTETRLPLAAINTVKGTGENKEYTVEVYAFDAQGALLSASDTKYGGASFVLTDGNEIVKKPTEADMRHDIHKEKLQKFLDNKKRLDAVELLIDEDLLDEADKLMAKVVDSERIARKGILQGYLAAKRGNCELANKLFDEVRDKEGKSCIPVRYQSLCVEKILN